VVVKKKQKTENLVKTDEKKRETVFAIAENVPVFYRKHGLRFGSGIGF
jgi:hypothetical protein